LPMSAYLPDADQERVVQVLGEANSS